jgi:hypothetical protein
MHVRGKQIKQAEKEQTIQWSTEKEDNTMVNRIRTNNDLQSTTQTTKD